MNVHPLFAIVAILLVGLVGAAAISSTSSPAPNLAKVSTVSTAGSQNFLVVILDDVGVEQIAAYAEGANPVNTPTINQLAAEGMLFRNAYSNPVCSPTRSNLQTGRYAFRHGIGHIILPTTGPALSHSELTLPEMLDVGTNGKYAHALFGKWHLGNNTNGYHDSPNLAGYSHYSGNLFNIGKIIGTTYFKWEKTVDGSFSQKTGYLTTDTVDDAIAWTGAQTKPWLAVVAFNAPHAPFHNPPANLHTVNLSNPTELLQYQAALEAVDTELGRLIQHLKQTQQYANTTILVIGDNGTPKAVAVNPIPPEHAKDSLYEGGINVPFIVKSPFVSQRGSESGAFVNAVDVMATIAEMAGVNLSRVVPGIKLDSVSMVPYLQNSGALSLRSTNFSESFTPIQAQYGDIPPASGATQSSKTMRDVRYKLIWNTLDNTEEFYDLVVDPYENTNLLLGGLTSGSPEEQSYLKLKTDIVALVNS